MSSDVTEIKGAVRSAAPHVAAELRCRIPDAVEAGRFSQAEMFARAADAVDPTVLSAIFTGEMLAAWGRDADAEASFVEAWERSKRAGDPRLVNAACLALVAFHREAGRLALARRFEQLATQSLVKADLDLNEETLLSYAAGALLDRGDTDTATAYAAATLGIDRESADGWALLGLCALVENAPTTAGERLYRAYRKHRADGDATKAAADLHFVGLSLREEGRFREAEVCHRSAEQVWRKHGYVDAATESAGLAGQCRRVDLAAGTVPGEN